MDRERLRYGGEAAVERLERWLGSITTHHRGVRQALVRLRQGFGTDELVVRGREPLYELVGGELDGSLATVVVRTNRPKNGPFVETRHLETLVRSRGDGPSMRRAFVVFHVSPDSGQCAPETSFGELDGLVMSKEKSRHGPIYRIVDGMGRI